MATLTFISNFTVVTGFHKLFVTLPNFDIHVSPYQTTTVEEEGTASFNGPQGSGKPSLVFTRLKYFNRDMLNTWLNNVHVNL